MTRRCAKCSPPSNQEFGRLDALVNNAGTTSNVKPSDFEAMTAEEWDRVFAVNVRGMFQVTRAAAPLLKAARGSVVNTASIVGLRPGPQPLPYAASKAAVVSLTKLLALNLAPDVRVNAVAPGWMEGDWMKRMLADRYDDLMARRAKSTPLAPLRDRRRRRRSHRQSDYQQSLRKRRDHCDRRRIFSHNVAPASRRQFFLISSGCKNAGETPALHKQLT